MSEQRPAKRTRQVIRAWQSGGRVDRRIDDPARMG